MACPSLEEILGGAGAEHAAQCPTCKARIERAETHIAPSSCGTIEALLAARAVGPLAPEGEGMLDRHLARCAACREIAQDLDDPIMARLLARIGDATDSFAHEVGDVVAQRYRVVRFLGKGGMGEVYEVEDLLLKERVALKTLSAPFAHDEAKLALFKRELHLARKVTHPNVCRTFDFGLDRRGARETAFFTMELLEGETLSARLRRDGRLDTAAALPIAVQVAAGLGAAHAAGIIHLDLKCANIMLVDSPQGSRAVVTDMGLARIAVGDTEERGEALVGTLAYMAPEQVEGGQRLTAACDIYAFGTVLYEMVTGRLPFVAEAPLVAAMMRLDAPPPPPRSIVPELEPRWERAILACLDRSPDARPAEAREVLRILRPERTRRRTLLVAAAAAIAALAILAGWLWRDSARTRWARETATPEIERLVGAERYTQAAELATRAHDIIPGDATLDKLWRQATFEVSVDSTPAGAEVLYRPYRADPQSWARLGTTPLTRVRLPRDFYVWQVAKPGFAPAWQIAPSSDAFPYHAPDFELSFHLAPADTVPEGMVAIPGGAVELVVPGLGTTLTMTVDGFLIDRHEVTNVEYQTFVDAGGYRRPELWKEPFVRDGQPVSWTEAMAAFQDATGRAGPSTWTLGTFPKGQDRFPVGGVSFYEAAAYAAFVGKTLPTMYHWSRAAQTDAGMLIVNGSNFEGSGPVTTEGAGAMSGFGTFDMAGNMKEWCVNEGRDGKRFIAGGGFDEPKYMFVVPDAHSPWSRMPTSGLRCVLLAAPVSALAAGSIAEPARDFRAEAPVSDEVFRAFERAYAYDRTPLHARVDSVEETDEWRLERVSFDAAYGRDRVAANLYLPKTARPPFQTVVFFPGSGALFEDRFELLPSSDYIPRTGRALMVPIFKGTYQRRDGLKSIDPEPTVFFRDHMIEWSNDLARSLDYLETRPDIDRERFAYLGFSWGAAVAPILLAMNHRIKAAILESGGLYVPRALPEVEAVNFAGRVHVPVLMLNGRYDNFFSVEGSQRPLLDLLGTRPDQKRHIVYDSGHIPPRAQVILEGQRWLDTYLGPVAK